MTEIQPGAEPRLRSRRLGAFALCPADVIKSGLGPELLRVLWPTSLTVTT